MSPEEKIERVLKDTRYWGPVMRAWRSGASPSELSRAIRRACDKEAKDGVFDPVANVCHAVNQQLSQLSSTYSTNLLLEPRDIQAIVHCCAAASQSLTGQDTEFEDGGSFRADLLWALQWTLQTAPTDLWSSQSDWLTEQVTKYFPKHVRSRLGIGLSKTARLRSEKPNQTQTSLSQAISDSGPAEISARLVEGTQHSIVPLRAKPIATVQKITVSLLHTQPGSPEAGPQTSI